MITVGKLTGVFWRVRINVEGKTEREWSIETSGSGRIYETRNRQQALQHAGYFVSGCNARLVKITRKPKPSVLGDARVHMGNVYALGGEVHKFCEKHIGDRIRVLVQVLS